MHLPWCLQGCSSGFSVLDFRMPHLHPSFCMQCSLALFQCGVGKDSLQPLWAPQHCLKLIENPWRWREHPFSQLDSEGVPFRGAGFRKPGWRDLLQDTWGSDWYGAVALLQVGGSWIKLFLRNFSGPIYTFPCTSPSGSKENWDKRL